MKAFSRFLPVLAILIGLSGILTCSSPKKVTSNFKKKIGAVALLPGDVTVRYDDSADLKPFTPESGRLYGVWFSPPKDGNYSLIAFNCYLDSTSAETVPCFVNRVARYDGEAQLPDTGRHVVSLPLLHSTGTRWTAELASPLSFDSNDFFIGWRALPGISITGLEDTWGTNPPRTYFYNTGLYEGLVPLHGNLAISAVFRPSASDTGRVTIWLSWHTETNLDLQLTGLGSPPTEYVASPQMGDSWGDSLNHDFRDSSGPEIITVKVGQNRSDSLQVRVHFKGPGSISKRSLTLATVVFRRGSEFVRSDTASLALGNYWYVGTVNTKTGHSTPRIPRVIRTQP